MFPLTMPALLFSRNWKCLANNIDWPKLPSAWSLIIIILSLLKMVLFCFLTPLSTLKLTHFQWPGELIVGSHCQQWVIVLAWNGALMLYAF